MQKVIAVVGPTSSGKTALGVWLAKRIKAGPYLGAEVISADSRQVYKGLNLGTGKVTKKEMAGIPHHLLDVASPKKVFSVSDFKRLGEKAITLIYQSDHIPLIVGGTGLYVDVLVGRIVLPDVPPNPELRAKLVGISAEQLMKLLTKADPERAATIEPAHTRRIVRALEIAAAVGKSPAKAGAMQGEEKYKVLWIGLNPGQEVLGKKIKLRLRARLKQGMLREAKKLHQAGLSYKRMQELGLEYRSMAAFLQKEITENEMLAQLDIAITNYAKRQMRWFKRNEQIHWISNKSEALKLVKTFIAEK